MITAHIRRYMSETREGEERACAVLRSFCDGLAPLLDAIARALEERAYPQVAEGAGILRGRAEGLYLHEFADTAATLELAAAQANEIACTVHYGALCRAALTLRQESEGS